jgi:hypothetical protein
VGFGLCLDVGLAVGRDIGPETPFGDVDPALTTSAGIAVFPGAVVGYPSRLCDVG